MKYRPEIDGLRAVAVIPVILFHVGFGSFSGGYVGVDVFFVISGYLITTLILSAQERGSFSILEFYERRIRRILPALFTVMLVSLPFAWLWLSPGDMKDFSDSLIAVSTFSSNVLFWHESGYWESASELKPLLHTWSLAVEEQFYLLFPAFLLLTRGLGRRWTLGAVLTLATISLGLSWWAAQRAPALGFYLLPTRIWELAIGVVIGFCLLHRSQSQDSPPARWRSMKAELLPAIGLGAIGFAVVCFDHRTPFPGLHALVPTLGAALVIVFCTPRSWIGRLLSSRPMVTVGLISYSAYLWHFLIFALARHRALADPDPITLGSLGVASLVLAYLSWRYVERPFRDRTKLSRKQIFRFALAGSATFIVIGLMGRATHGFAERRGIDALSASASAQALDVNPGLSVLCDGNKVSETACRTDEQPDILVWGDSYAMHLVDGILASNPKARIIQVTKSVCGPIFDRAPSFEPGYGPAWGAECLAFNDAVHDWLKTQSTLRYAVLSSPFIQYLSGDNLDRDGELRPTNVTSARAALLSTLAELEGFGIKPIVFSPPPSNGRDLGRCVVKAKWQGASLDDCNFSMHEMSEDVLSAHDFLMPIAPHYRVVFLEDLLCPAGRCITHLGTIPVFRDAGHFSRAGSAAAGRKFDFYSLIVDDVDVGATERAPVSQ